ncbi:hypothetical protein ACTHAM_002290 [Cellulomonas soli]|uniref:hypothetical protein n=1 Tax=Cellulomonas soli TaxID=931535 RepID=UPI003F851837
MRSGATIRGPGSAVEPLHELDRVAVGVLHEGHAQQPVMEGVGAAHVGAPRLEAELFEAALDEAAQRYEDWRDERLAGETDPFRRLAMSIRLTGRLHWEHPQEADLLIRQLTFLRAGTRHLPARVREDVVAAIEAVPVSARAASRADVTVIAAAQLPDDARADLADALAADILRLLGVDDDLIVGLVAEPIG